MTALLTLLTGMTSGNWKTLTNGADPFTGACLARTKANFDGNGSTWVSDAAVARNPMLGIDVAAAISGGWSFSGAAISPDTLRCVYSGGGHTDSGDGSVFDLDPTLSSGNDLTWTLRCPGPQYIDAFTNTRPSSGTSPAGAQETAPSTSSAVNQNYWTMKNKDGNVVIPCGHSYYYNKYIPGTSKVVMSRFAGFDTNGGSKALPNAGYVYDDTAHTFTGPFVDTGTSGFTQELGYMSNDSNNTGIAVNDLDGTIWALPKSGVNRISQWTNPTNSSIALVYSGVFAGLNFPWTGIEGGAIAMMPDPGNSARRALFQHCRGALTDTKFSIITGINGTTYGAITDTDDVLYGTGSVTTLKDTNGIPHLDYAWDTNRSVLWMWDAVDLYQITPNATLTSFSVAKITSAGDTWAAPSGTSYIPTLQYNRAYDCLIAVDQAIVKVFKPSGWSPTLSGSSLRRNSNLDGLSASGPFFADPLVA